MKKGINSLELVFMMFILIVVALVLIRLFTGVVRQDTLPNIDEFRYAYNYDKEKVKCGNSCNPYITSGCTDIASAVAFCQQKVNVDIDGDYNTGGKGHYGLIAKIPYCEDGLYCFHIYDCSCGTFTLDASQCLWVMKEYYEQNIGLDESTSNQIVCTSVLPGTCETNPIKWKKKLPGYTPIRLPDGSVLGADYWWIAAGYADICQK